MTNLKRSVRDDRGIEKQRPADLPPRRRPQRSRTAGTNRDFDATGVAANPGHGHPREERRAASRPGARDRAAVETGRTPKKLPGSRTGQGRRRPA
ncbi:MAG TPA: hypothetical protein VKZ58_08255 [Longimicrobiales bacterium]|nr:hypothetical protein [Longimicrobiales bacterium]